MQSSQHKLRFFNFQGTSQVSHALYQTQIFRVDALTQNHAQRGLVDAKIYTEINVPLQQLRRYQLFKIYELLRYPRFKG